MYNNEKNPAGIRLTHFMAAVFTVSSALLFALSAAFVYQSSLARTDEQIKQQQESDIRQLDAEISAWLHSQMHVLNAVYYDIILDVDYQSHDLSKAFDLLYDASKSNLKQLSLFSEDGTLLFSSPAAVLKNHADATNEEWFAQTIQKSADICFYPPQVQHLFAEQDYASTIPMCRPVLLTKGKQLEKGILLMDLNYSAFARMIEDAVSEQDGCIYLTDANGSIIYHPQKWILTESEKEECRAAALSSGEPHREGRIYTCSTRIGYTGWILVSRLEHSPLQAAGPKAKAFYLMMAMVFITIIVVLNVLLSYYVAGPFRQLESAVQKIKGDHLDFTPGPSGIYEIQSLGSAISHMAARIQELIQNINREHELKRKSEMDALQSQIHPHFLYNTLDVIVWLIENEKPKEAARAVVLLAKFFRISLSRGKQIITVKNEMAHVESYLGIQNLKYQNRFAWHIETSPETEQLSTLKLILQPLVENAIGHGILRMPDEGEILVKSMLQGEELLFIVEDNGCGMTEETVEQLLKGEIESSGGHSGIGVKNVNQRIKLYFGERYGLEIESEFDEGTKITVHLPIIPYEEKTDEKI